MADEKEELEPKDGEGTEGEGKQQEPKQEEPKSKEGEGKSGEGEGIKDKHGQPGINKERHEKEMAAKDAKIAELEAQVAKAAETKEGREKLEKQIADLKAEQADERVTHKLEMAGCKSAKAAKALLEDYDNDIPKLKEACPYLFEDEKPKGKTGGKPIGSAGKSIEDKIDAVFDN